MNTDLVTKINLVKGTIQNFWEKLSENDFEMAKQKFADISQKMQSRGQTSTVTDVYADDYDHNYADDLPLTINREDPPGVRGEGIKYSVTENSPMAVGAEKVSATGIDKFGDEDDTYEEGSSLKNSDLDERFYTPGLNSKDIH